MEKIRIPSKSLYKLWEHAHRESGMSQELFIALKAKFCGDRPLTDYEQAFIELDKMFPGVEE
jgi:hypothetical protein